MLVNFLICSICFLISLAFCAVGVMLFLYVIRGGGVKNWILGVLSLLVFFVITAIMIVVGFCAIK